MKKTDYLQIIRRFALTTTLSVVLGFGSAANAQTYSWILDTDGKGLVKLGALGGNNTVASDINDVGQVVGYSHTTSGERHAFITGPNGAGMTDLGTLNNGEFAIGDFSYATGINTSGQVTGPPYWEERFVVLSPDQTVPR